ncbi:MAG: KH domain-containing protein [Clostridia bacterium]|nr:KH domain-containing protein [Clostridia bacterium]
MKELLIYIVSNIVEHPEDVVVTEEATDEELTLKLSVNPSDVGKVIGRQGRIARAIRTIVKSASAAESRKVSVDIQS